MTAHVAKLQHQIAIAGAEAPGSMPAQTINISALVWKFRSVTTELAEALNNLGIVIADNQTTEHDLERAFTCFDEPLTIIVNALLLMESCARMNFMIYNADTGY